MKRLVLSGIALGALLAVKFSAPGLWVVSAPLVAHGPALRDKLGTGAAQRLRRTPRRGIKPSGG